MLPTNNITRFIGKYFVDANSIVRCEASSNYTKLFFTNQPPLLIAKTLSNCANAIKSNDFIRINRSQLINRKFIAHIQINGDIFLKDGTVCNMSRRKKKEAKEMLCTG
jgi:two-component system, LytTR family, response regulator